MPDWLKRIKKSVSLSRSRGSSLERQSTPQEQSQSTLMISAPSPLLPASSSTTSSPAIPPPVHPVQAFETTTPTFRSTAKNIAIKSLKITLATLKEVLDDIPVPGAVAINTVIKLIEVTENAHDENSGLFLAAINNEDDAVDIKDMSRRITQLLESFSIENDIAGAIVMQNILDVVKTQMQFIGDITGKIDEHELTTNIESLPCANAAYNGSSQEGISACFEGTRTQVLSEIANWISLEDALFRIYILDGIVGIGKTTIAKTIADRAAVLGYLGASFFFSRNEAQHKSGELFFSTIVYQLAHYDRDFKVEIGEAVSSIGRNSIRKGLQDQLQELLVRPLTDQCGLSGGSYRGGKGRKLAMYRNRMRVRLASGCSWI